MWHVKLSNSVLVTAHYYGGLDTTMFFFKDFVHFSGTISSTGYYGTIFHQMKTDDSFTISYF